MATQEKAVLDHKSAKAMPNFAEVMPRVSAEYGKSLTSQLKDMLSLCMRGNKLAVDEYYQMRLFDGKTFGDAEKKKMVGLQKSRMIWSEFLRDNRWQYAVNDKLAYEKLMAAFGFKTPNTLAIIGGHYPNNQPKRLESVEDIKAFFESAPMPLFGKPADSYQSLGSARLEAYNKKDGTLSLANGSTVTVENFFAEVESHYKGTYLLQECVEPHDLFKKLGGSGLPTLRVVTLDRGHGPELYRACLKIIGNGNVADNFWRNGNLLAAVNLETGELGKALTAMGIDGQFVEKHPDTDQQIEGVVLPFFEETRQMALDAHRMMPGANLFGFDLAITNDGPVLIEGNCDPHLIMLQITHQKGVLDQMMLDALAHTSKQREDRLKGVKKALEDERVENKEAMNKAVSRKAA